MDARFWGQRNIDAKQIGGAGLIPVGDRVSTRVAPAGGEEFSIANTGQFIVLECEAGNHRVRSGRLIAQTFVDGDVSAADDTITITGHGYVDGDGPLRLDQAVKMTGDPSLTFDLIGAANDELVRATGSWVDDGFAATDVITISGTASNDGDRTILSISTTTNPDDTLEFAGDVLVDEVGVSGVRVVVGALPAGLLIDTDYWIKVVDANTIQLSTSADVASVVDITAAAGGGTHAIGGDCGSDRDVGLDVLEAPTASLTAGEGGKLLVPGEVVLYRGRAITLRSYVLNDRVSYWVV